MVNVLRVLVFVFIFILLLYLSLLILFVISLGISVLFRVICPHQPSSAPFPSHPFRDLSTSHEWAPRLFERSHSRLTLLSAFPLFILYFGIYYPINRLYPPIDFIFFITIIICLPSYSMLHTFERESLSDTSDSLAYYLMHCNFVDY
jgi:hypothetical protein